MSKSKGGTSGKKAATPNTATKNGISLSLSLSDVDILLYPTDQGAPSTSADIVDSPDVSQRDTTVVAHITLNVPANVSPPSNLQSLIVELRSDETLGFPSGLYERNTPHQIRKEVESAKDMVIQKGREYHWDVTLDVSGASAPYERCIYGRLFHKVVVTAEWSGWLKANKRLEVEQFVFLAPVPISTDLLNYAHTHEGFRDAIGPIVMHAQTRQLSVGGYLRAALSLPSTTPGIELLDFKLTVIQHTILTSRKKPSHHERGKPERMTFLEVGQEELQSKLKRNAVETGGDSLDATWVARLPKDNMCRCSTVAGSQAAIRHNHEIEMVLNYKDAMSSAAETYRVTWPLPLPACSMLWKHLKLPSYSEYDPSPVPEWTRDAWDQEKFANVHLSQRTCACGQTLEKLLSWEDDGDDEEMVCTTNMVREAVQLATHNSNLRSRSRQRAAFSRSATRTPSRNVSRDVSRDISRDASRDTSRSASRANSIHSPQSERDTAMDIAEEDEELRRHQLEVRRRQKASQLYTRV